MDHLAAQAESGHSNPQQICLRPKLGLGRLPVQPGMTAMDERQGTAGRNCDLSISSSPHLPDFTAVQVRRKGGVCPETFEEMWRRFKGLIVRGLRNVEGMPARIRVFDRELRGRLYVP